VIGVTPCTAECGPPSLSSDGARRAETLFGSGRPRRRNRRDPNTKRDSRCSWVAQHGGLSSLSGVRGRYAVGGNMARDQEENDLTSERDILVQCIEQA
jgi:hypothetical protein